MIKIVEVIQRWEELGQQLEQTVATYLDACRVLESLASGDPASAHSLVSRIDHRIESFSACLSQRLSLTHSSIMRTRNAIVSPAHRLPREILSKIFYLSIYPIDVKASSHLTSEYTIQTIYRRLHALSGVCSLWRRVGLEEAFWSLVPIIEQPSGRHTPTAAQLSLERAPNHRLGLVANLKDSRPDLQDFVATMFSQHSHRFDSINLYSNSPASIAQTMDILLGCTSSRRLAVKDLSLCYTHISRQETHRILTRAVPTEYPFTVDTPNRSAVKLLVESLRVLHLSGLMIPLEGTSLRNLTQLTLQKIALQNNLDFVSSLHALASSTQLRTLKIISVSVLFWTTQVDVLVGLPIFLPSLGHLYMEDLISALLQLTLRSISPGFHLVSINWADKSTALDSHGPPRFSTEMSLSNFKIDVLYMSGPQNTRYPFTNVIRRAMEALPNITKLHLDSFVIDSKVLERLGSTSVNVGGPFANPRGFPELKSLYISRSHCHDLKVLRNLPKVFANYLLEELGIGIGPDCSCSSKHSTEPGFDSEMELIWKSLVHMGPKLRRLPTKTSEISDNAFESHIWQLFGLD